MNEGWDDVRLGKIVSLEKQRLTRGLGECVGEAVTEVKTRRMATLAKIGVCLARKMRLFLGYRFNPHPCAAQKGVELPAAASRGLGFHDCGNFNEGRRRDFAGIRVAL